MNRLAALFRLCMVGSLLLLPGCTFNRAVHQTQSLLTDLHVIDRAQLHGSHYWVVPRNVIWLVAVPVNGVDPQVDGRVARALASALRQEFAGVYLAPAPDNLQKNLQTARQLGAHAVVQADLLRYADGAYSWSEWWDADMEQPAGRGELGVKLVVYDAWSGRAVDTMTLRADEGWWPSLSEQQDALMEKVFGQFASRVAYRDAEIIR